jgi:hypothetical protein
VLGPHAGEQFPTFTGQPLTIVVSRVDVQCAAADRDLGKTPSAVIPAVVLRIMNVRRTPRRLKPPLPKTGLSRRPINAWPCGGSYNEAMFPSASSSGITVRSVLAVIGSTLFSGNKVYELVDEFR